MSKQSYFKQFSLAKVQFNSIGPIDRTLSGATTPDQSGPGSDGNEGVLRIPQSSTISGTSPSDCLVSSEDTCWWGVGLAEKQSVYSTAPADRINSRETAIYFHQNPYTSDSKKDVRISIRYREKNFRFKFNSILDLVNSVCFVFTLNKLCFFFFFLPFYCISSVNCNKLYDKYY